MTLLSHRLAKLQAPIQKMGSKLCRRKAQRLIAHDKFILEFVNANHTRRSRAG